MKKEMNMRQFMLQHFAAASESIEVGELDAAAAAKTIQKEPENEIAFYAQVGNWLGLDEALSQEDQEQWEIKIASTEEGRKKRVRVRRTTPLTKDGSGELVPGQDNFVLTAKTKVETGSDVTGNMEENVEVGPAVFTLFKGFSESGMIKRRYRFNSNSVLIKYDGKEVKIAEALVGFEVDVFPLKNGESGYSPWVKIDVEVDKVMAAVKDLGLDRNKIEFNIDPSKLPFKPVNIIQGGDPETDAAIQELYDKVFISQPSETTKVASTSADEPVQEEPSAEEPPKEEPDQTPAA